MRKCTGRCGRELPATEEYFHRSKTGKYGLQSKCIECERVCRAAYSAAHREQRHIYDAAYRKEHREEIRTRQTLWHAEHKEEERVRGKGYRAAHQKEIAAYNASRKEKLHSYYISHREAAHRRAAVRYANNKEAIARQKAAYLASPRGQAVNKAHHQRYRARIRNLPYNFTAEDFQYARDYWRGLCPCCGKQVNDLWGEIKTHADHWIPISAPNCPGTVPWNMLPLCNKCNSSKRDKEPRAWVMEKFGKRQGAAILKRIDEYFAGLRPYG